MRASIALASLTAGALHATASRLPAQQRLLGERTLGGATTVEAVRFGGAGLQAGDLADSDSSRVRRVVQVALPISAAVTLGGGWRMDITSLVASGRVTFVDPRGVEQSATLAGVSDVRVRATGKLWSDALLVTVGANAPTGRTSLDGGQFGALRVLAAPALGLGSSPVGSGPSGTLGMVYARQAAAWTTAIGVSVEYRGRFQPVAALVAGAPSIDFQPGSVLRGSFSADRLIGRHRLHLSTSADVFAQDRLRDGGVTASTGAGALTTVRLGPVLSSDLQIDWAAPRLREFVTYSSYRFRAPYARDGRTVTDSEGQYLEGGARIAAPIARSTDLVAGLDARWHSGLGIDRGLPGAGVTSALALLGLRVRAGRFSLQPYLRGQAGSVRVRGTTTPLAAQPFTGATAGLILVSRF
jgi:hypothetical protein